MQSYARDIAYDGGYSMTQACCDRGGSDLSVWFLIQFKKDLDITERLRESIDRGESADWVPYTVGMG